MMETFLEVKQLRKVFGGVVAVNDLSFEAEDGNITSVIGPNGAGKTTMFNLITGFTKPTSGQIFLKGREISGLKVHHIAAMGVARTFQHVQIFPEMTVLENVMVGRHTRSASGLLHSFLIPPFFRKEEKKIRDDAAQWLAFAGLETLAERSAGSLPLGNQRMLEIARAMAAEPGFLLLDEPASGLNARETLVMGSLIGKIKEMGITVLLVEHDMELVMDVSDKVVVINFGTCIAQGTPAQVQVNPDVIAAYLGE
ncbi:MAG: ABC transporter ATP-binding protein [Desulfobacterales bacterium]